MEKSSPSKKRLDRDVWIRAGLRALRDEGIAGVRVEVLAKALGVTKGSFYWHFAGRSAFLAEVLESWRAISTFEVINTVEAAGGSPADKLRNLCRICVEAGVGRLESAVRAWGMTDSSVGEVLGAVDTIREDYVTGLLEAHGLKKGEARKRARILYLALIGEFTWVAHGGDSTKRPVWKSLTDLMLS